MITVCERDFWLWLAIANHMSRARILTGTIFQQYFNVIQYPPRQYLNNISLCNDIQPHDISTVLHSAPISTRTIFQQYITIIQQYPLWRYFNNVSQCNSIRWDDISKASAPATNQEQQSTDLAFGKIQVPRRNWFGCTYVHTQISMVKLKRSKIYSFHGLCQLKRYILG